MTVFSDLAGFEHMAEWACVKNNSGLREDEFIV
jgi:hypothetical protein